MNRICFLSPDVRRTEQVVNLLSGFGIEKENIYVVANRDLVLDDLPDAGGDTNDFLPAYTRGVSVGGVVGLLAGLTAVAFPPSGVVFGGGAILASTLAAAGLGGLISGIAGAAYTNSSLNTFKAAIAEGQLLVMADVPADQVDEIEASVSRTHPRIRLMGVEPSTPLLG